MGLPGDCLPQIFAITMDEEILRSASPLPEKPWGVFLKALYVKGFGGLVRPA
jgi:hypothetical protein